MKRAIKVIVAIVFLNTWFISNLFSQEGLKGTQEERLRYLSYNFPSDSLKGFDQASANNAALAGGFFGIEYKVYMYRAKRDFINNKYGYGPAPTMNNAKGITPIINAAPCVNEDFEASPVGLVGATLAGWTISEGSNSNSCTMGGCCPTAGGADAWIRTTPYASGTTIGTIPNSPFGGTKVLQMNDQFTNMGETVRIQQTFPVTATNALFRLAYMAQMDGTGHVCCDQPFLKITMLNCSNVPLACPSLSLNAPGASCATTMPAGWSTNTSGYSYTTAWQIYSLDLTPYLGSCVTIQVTVGDCDGWAHHGMAFIDCVCSPMTVTVNNIPFPVGTTATNVSACGATSGTVTAPPGLGPYSWTGPAGSGITNNPNQTFTTSVSGNYVVTMNPPGSCAPITRTVTLTFAPNPLATFTSANSCTTYTFTNTGTAAPAVQTFSFVGPGAPASFTTTSPTSVVNFAPSTTYTVFHTVTNTSSCTATNSMVINVPNGPNPAFTTATYTQCLTGNAFTFNAASNPGTHSYSFSPSVGAPAVGNANPYGPVSFTAQGTYTVTHVLTNAGCTSSTSSVVVINPQPTVAVSNNGPMCVGGNVALTTTATAGATFNWSGPGGFASAIANPTLTSVTPASAGVYNVTVTLNGCTGTGSTNVVISTATVAPTNTGPYCPGQTIQLNTAAATSYTWSGPNAFASNLQNPTIAGATPVMAGTYSLSITNGGCAASGTTAVVVNAAITPTASNTGPYCAGSTIQLNSSAANTYTWSGPGGFTSNAQNPTIATSSVANSGNYTISVTTAAGCTGSITTAVVVNPIPVPVIGSNSPVCLNTTINLTSGGGTSYAWSGPNSFTSTLQNPTIASATAINSGVYTVTVTSLNCSRTATVNVNVLAPTTTAANTGPYCAGQTIQLSTPAGTTYTWTGPGGFTSSVQNPTIPSSTAGMSGTYNVTVAVGSCTASANTNVVVNALPNPTAGSNSPICQGQTLNLTGSAASTYTWSGPNTFASNVQNPSITSASVAASGTYTFIVTDANNCTNSVTAVVVVNSNPIITVNNPTVCIGTTINLNSTGGTGYAWSGPSGFNSSAQNPSIANATTGMTGAYTVTVTSAQGCTNTAVANVNVFPVPSPTITSNSPVCVGGVLNLNGSGGAVYAWAGPNGFVSVGQNASIPNVSLLADGVYTLLVTAGSCSASTTASITINPLPNPTINSNSPICVGNDINLTGNGGTGYAWSGPGGFTSTAQNPTITAAGLSNSGLYTLVVTDANSCVNTTSATVIVNPQPIVAAAGSTVCENANATLSANGGVTYSWSGPGGFTSNSQNPQISSVPLTASGQYTVFITDANTCTNTAVANMIINPAPVPNMTANNPCANTSLNLTASGGVSYSWTGPGSFSSNVQNPTISNAASTVSGVYNVTVTDANGCSATTSTNVVVNPLPLPSIAGGPNTGCAPLCVQFNVTSIPSASTAAWNLGNGSVASGLTANSCYNTAGIYTISAGVTDQNGCSGVAIYTVEVYPQPIADFNHAPIKPIINIDGEVTFTDASHGANIVSWNWYFMNTAQYTSNVQNPIFMYTEAGTYPVALVVKSDKGCSDTIVRPLVVGEDYGIYVPNAFTPNDDGINDKFQPKGFGIVKYNIKIFDRWGEIIFQTSTFEEGWDGKYQGRGGPIVEEGVYTWLIQVTNVFGKAHELKGHVTLIK